MVKRHLAYKSITKETPEICIVVKPNWRLDGESYADYKKRSREAADKYQQHLKEYSKNYLKTHPDKKIKKPKTK